MLYRAIYIPQGNLAARLKRHKARHAASAYYPSHAVPGERVQGWHTMTRCPGGARWIDIGSDLRVVPAEGLSHDGWYCDNHQDETFVPVVVRLPHGRLMAGYREPWNDGVCVNVDAGSFTCIREASHAADEFARVEAERQRDFEAEEEAANEAEDAHANDND